MIIVPIILFVLEMSQDTPPQDVDGEGGYASTFEVLADPVHPDHEPMLHSGSLRGYGEFDI
ncbi:IS1096 element passenger TnpR family protein [Mesobacillus zeae]|uniref:Plasmid pRiA4b Orf3-like domain-containing protein n=1 Tax=Mesobacillus zeae TaxID=1917180 RepID=A0A398B072_9BACI|nr:hypothetical protein [Mesobacillus zeae]RID82674.1 hypothetical protein D1970_18245 [Mesobacillus zeae]